jgi:predicted AAA+ superfamily ATPase
MKIPRVYEQLEAYLEPNKVLAIFGPRQVGKTTLVVDFLARTKLRYRLESGDDARIYEALGQQNFDAIKQFCAGYDLIVIDEAQRIPNIGMGLKIMVDQIPGLRVIVTGSSSFELAGQIGEPLVGRKRTLLLFPLSQLELRKFVGNDFNLKNQLEERLIYGSYPVALTKETPRDKRIALEEVAHAYLLKDILELERVKGSKVLIDLLRLLAFQIGNEVSFAELATQVGIDTKTVARYLDLFEKTFILFNARGYQRNLRQEVSRKSKYYFYDNGIRNALISNFNPLALRDDVGALWENFIFMERLKKREYTNIYANVYFWRTWQQQEVDIVEEREGRLYGYEVKWGAKKVKSPKLWLETYQEASFEVVNQENYLDFVA